MTTKAQADKAKKALAALTKDDLNVMGIGLSKDDDGSYVVALRLAKKPTKKLMTALTKAAGEVGIQTEVVGEVKALPVKKVAKKAKKATPKKTVKKATTTLSITAHLKAATLSLNKAMEQLNILKTVFPIS